MAATNSDNISSSPAATLDGETVGERYSSERPLPAQAEKNEAVDHVLYSDIGISTLLTRLKQSIASAKDFAAFLKKRSSLEEDHAQGLKKLCRATYESGKGKDGRTDSFSRQHDEALRMQERMADNGMQFALSLHQMHEDLNELSSNIERGRKQWKATGLNAEKKAQDAEAVMEKARSKYDSLAEDYDRVRTGDKTRNAFGLKKSGPQHEEELLKKVQVADQDYSSKVQAAKMQRQELITKSRPEAVKALSELIQECDAALTLQLQKFALLNEKLVLGNGIILSPMPNENGAPKQHSLREVVSDIDNERDLRGYIVGQTSRVPARTTEIQYHKHPTLVAPTQPPPGLSSSAAPRLSTQLNASQTTPPAHLTESPQQPPYTPSPQSHFPSSTQSPYASNYPPQHDSPFDRIDGGLQPYDRHVPHSSPIAAHSAAGSPMMAKGPAFPTHQGPPPPPTHHGPPANIYHQPPTHLPPPIKPVFGINLEYLFRRDSTPVPLVVHRCVQAIELFGLEAEGIYRLSGNPHHVNHLKALFDNDASKVDLAGNPESFYHDVHSVAALLKHFFRELPDPLFTSERYPEFIEAARIDDDSARRDSLHAIINGLPDPNYATLRTVILHLNRVSEHAHANRMSASNLAICLAPTLMGQHHGHLADAGLQARVLDTVLLNTFRIFDEE